MPLEGALSTRPPSAEDSGQAFSLSSRFCFYVRFRLQLHSAGVQTMFGINVLVLTSKSHMRGVCNRLLVNSSQWKHPRGVERTLGGHGAPGLWLAPDFWLARGVRSRCDLKVKVRHCEVYVTGSWLTRASGSAPEESRGPWEDMVYRAFGWHRAFGRGATIWCDLMRWMLLRFSRLAGYCKFRHEV